MDTYFYYYNHANRYHDHQFSGDCSCTCFSCLYKLDLIFLLIVIYLLLMDKITINIQSADGSSASGTLPLLPIDEDGPELTSANDKSSKCDNEPDESPNSLPESVVSSTSTASTTTSGRKLIKPDISLDFLDASDEDEEEKEDENENENDDSKINGESDNYCQDNLCNEELFSNVFISSSRGKRKSCFNVKRQSSFDSDSLSWDSSSASSSSSSLSCPTTQQKQQSQAYSSLPCNLIDNVYVHEALEVDLPFNLSLTFTELGHIRKALAREELDSMSFCHSVREQLVNGKLCSTCLKTRFKLFGPWADCCRLCERPVCSRCSSNVQINAKRYNSIPIQLLVPNKRNRKSFTSSSLTSPLPSNPAKMKVKRQQSTSSLSFTSSSSSSCISLPIQSPSSVISSSPSSNGFSSRSFSRLNQWRQSKGSFTSSLPWLRKTVSKDGIKKVDEGDGEEDDEDQITRKRDKNVSTMAIKLCLDCEMFFVTLLAI